MEPVHRVMTRAIERRHFPAACLLVSVEGQPIVHRAYGRATLDSVFDLASLTKPLATVAVLMRLVAEGRLALDQRLDQLIAAVRGLPAGSATIKQLLSHSAGLCAWKPFFEEVSELTPLRARARIRAQAAREPLAYAPGTAVLYSDLGFILLDWVVEQVTGLPLDRAASRLIYEPLGLTRTGFIDLRRPTTLADRRARWQLVATERVAGRARLLGEVHDDNCRAMGGISGHAGLFATASDIDLIVRQLVAAYRGQTSLFDRRVVRRFFSARPVRNTSWALGWDRPSGARPSAGRGFGPRSVGHLGFTGCSLWIDLEAPWWTILLTNRVYYGSTPNPMRAFRPRLHDAVYRALCREGRLVER